MSMYLTTIDDELRDCYPYILYFQFLNDQTNIEILILYAKYGEICYNETQHYMGGKQ